MQMAVLGVLETAVIVHQAPIRCFLLASRPPDVCARAAKKRDRIRTRPEGVLLDTHAYIGTLSQPKWDSQTIKRIFFVKSGFAGLLAQQSPEKCAL